MLPFRGTCFLLFCLLSVTVAGCSDDNPVEPDDGGDPPPFRPGTPEQLMANFRVVHEERDFAGYLQVLDPGFSLHLREETVNAFGLPRNYLDYGEEIGCTEMMFSGNPPAAGVGAISDIDFMILRQIDVWSQTDNEDFTGAIESQYDVDVRIMQATTDGQKLINIKGRIIFFLSSEQVVYDDRSATVYRLLGMIDETGISKVGAVPTEDVSWGDVKALFRPADPSR